VSDLFDSVQNVIPPPDDRLYYAIPIDLHQNMSPSAKNRVAVLMPHPLDEFSPNQVIVDEPAKDLVAASEPIDMVQKRRRGRVIVHHNEH